MKSTKKYILSFSQSLANKPLTYHLIKDYNLIVNIINAEITAKKISYLILEISGKEEDIRSGVQFLENNRVQCEPFKKQLQFNEKNCISCGSCTGVCYSKALQINISDKKVYFDSFNCTACGLCVKACPLQLLHLNFNGIH